MEARDFDRLARKLSSRRTALGGLLAGLLWPLDTAARKKDKTSGKGKGKDRDHDQGKRKQNGNGKRKAGANGKGKGKGEDRNTPRGQDRTQAQTEPCWRAGACVPKKGSNVSQCDLSGYTTFPTLDCTGCNLSRANLRGINATNVTFTKANLSGACLVGADFTGATFARTTNLANAIFCRTIMPDGSVNDSGCGSATTCCPTCIPGGGACGATIGGSCCGGNCTSGICESCTPATCQTLGMQCGAWPDTCSGTLQCGACGAQQTCHAGSCVCAPTTCEAEGKDCGQIADGCGGTLACGDCTPPLTCGGGGTVNICGCAATTCQALGKQCGAWPDTCGTTLDCGSCGPGQVCNNGTCICSPATCRSLGKQCGAWPDNCEATLDCGSCGAGEACDNGQCVCAPATCQALGKRCGEWPDTCGATLECGSCGAGEICDDGECICVPATCQSLGKACGSWPDGCGGTLNCGGCSSPASLCCDGACISSISWANQGTFGTPGSGLSQFRLPQGITVSSDTLTSWVADTSNHRMSIWTRPDDSSPAWSYQAKFGSNGDGPQEFQAPSGITVSSDTLTAWVADTINNRISVWTRPDASSITWSNQTRFGSGGIGSSQFLLPLNTAVSPDTLTVWVADSENNRVSVWTRPSISSVVWTNRTTFGGSGSGLGQFFLPYDVAVSNDTLTVWVVEQNNARVSVWTRPTASSLTWTVQTAFGSGPGLLVNPSGIAVSSDKLTVWVTDTGNDRISVWTRPDASSIAWANQANFGSSGNGRSQFEFPIGVAVSRNERTVWVADARNNRISVWERVCPA